MLWPLPHVTFVGNVIVEELPIAHFDQFTIHHWTAASQEIASWTAAASRVKSSSL